MKKQVDFLSGLPMTMLGGVFLLLSFVLPRVGIALPIDPAWITVIVSGIPLLYLAVWRILHNPGISKISSALLITIAMFAAIAIGDLFAAGEVAWIMAIGAILEDMTTNRARKGLKKWIHLTPTQGRRIRGGEEELVSPEQIQTGDILRILPGETVPVDGVIIRGETSVDQSILTGESLPLDKGPGEEVFCGTINRFGSIDIRATKVGEDSSLQKLIRMVQEAEKKQAPMQRIADRCASWLVPAALLIAIATGLIKQDLIPAVTVLVVFCPCALVLATPTAIMVGTGLGAKHGILIRSGEILEITHSVDTVVLDKTGTVTQGTPAVTEIVPWETSEEALLNTAAAVEAVSSHPLADAITACARERGIQLQARPESFENLSGRGLKATLEGKTVLAGNRRLLQEHGVDPAPLQDRAEALSAQGQTPMYFALDGRLLGLISVADPVKETSADAIRRMKESGIHTVLLTGDNRAAAEHIGALVGVDEVIAEVLPEAKAGVVEKLQAQGRTVMMVGDGINDAPALTAADTGIPIGSGSDIAIESADIVLMRSDLQDVPRALRLSALTLRDIKQNLFWAFCYNTIGIPIAAGLLYLFGGPLLSPMFAGAAMSLSSVCVVGNALRLGRAKL